MLCQQSKAAEIPEELFEHILWHACDIGGGYSRSALKKPVAASVAMVCKYWARLAREELFCQITLRNLDDVTRFVAILDTPPPASLQPLPELVRTLVAAYDQRDMPWLHLVFMKVYPKLQHRPFLRVNALPSDGRPWRSLHPALPRTLPGSIMPLDRLALADVHFVDGRALARLLASLPLMLYVGIHRATFDTAPSRRDLFVPPFGVQLSRFTTDSFQLCIAMVHSLIAHSIEKGPTARICGGRAAKYVLDEHDAEILDELLSLFKAASGFECYHGSGRRGTKEADMQFLEISCHDLSAADSHNTRVAPRLKFYLDPKQERRLLRSEVTNESKPITLQVHTISIELTSGHYAPSAGQICTDSVWSQFVAAVMKLRCLQRVRVLQLLEYHAATWDMLRQSGFLGVNDTTFKPLMEAGRRVLECHFLQGRSMRTVQIQTKTLTHPKILARRKEKEREI